MDLQDEGTWRLGDLEKIFEFKLSKRFPSEGKYYLTDQIRNVRKKQMSLNSEKLITSQL